VSAVSGLTLDECVVAQCGACSDEASEYWKSVVHRAIGIFWSDLRLRLLSVVEADKLHIIDESWKVSWCGFLDRWGWMADREQELLVVQPRKELDY
jgi:hypothetical protein